VAAEHLADARLYATRQDMAAALVQPGGVIAEVGVALGDFSEFIIEALKPKSFVAFDVFTLHDVEVLWGTPTSEIFGSGTHLEQYRDRFEKYGDLVVIEEGCSWDLLARYPDDHFDMIYIDAGHDLDSVKHDMDVAIAKVRPDGVLIFNDYTMFDHMTGSPYGIVQNVNALVTETDWRIVGLALQRGMFCDIALRRPGV